MTIKRARELLGADISHLTDEEVFDLIAQGNKIASVFIDLTVKIETGENEEVDVRWDGI